jgi:hypothetical protein
VIENRLVASPAGFRRVACEWQRNFLIEQARLNRSCFRRVWIENR